jgi:ABC-type multidrug transport system fused ATPase/permease subunit
LVTLLLCAGLVGLSLSYAFSLTGAQIFWTRWFNNLSNYIISVERIKQFIHIPAEPPAIVDDNRPPSSWPSKGKIDLQGLEVMLHPCLRFILINNDSRIMIHHVFFPPLLLVFSFIFLNGTKNYTLKDIFTLVSD